MLALFWLMSAMAIPVAQLWQILIVTVIPLMILWRGTAAKIAIAKKRKQRRR